MIFFILYKIGEFLALLLPVGASYKLAGAVARARYAFARIEKREMVENLRQIVPDADKEKLKRFSEEIFVNFSMYLVDFLRFKMVDRAFIEKYLVIKGRGYLDEVLAKGKGLIIVSAHIGSWELGGAVLGVLGYPINVVVLDHKNTFVNGFFVRQRRMKNERVISIRHAGKSCFNCLRDNQILVLVGDKDFTGGGQTVEFLGKDAALPRGPAVFSLRTGAVIVPGVTIRKENGKFELIFGPLIEPLPTGNFEKDVSDLMQRYMAVLENYIRENPTQWYCFRRFWKEG